MHLNSFSSFHLRHEIYSMTDKLQLFKTKLTPFASQQKLMCSEKDASIIWKIWQVLGACVT
jgi:hypothetical protein